MKKQVRLIPIRRRKKRYFRIYGDVKFIHNGDFMVNALEIFGSGHEFPRRKAIEDIATKSIKDEHPTVDDVSHFTLNIEELSHSDYYFYKKED